MGDIASYPFGRAKSLANVYRLPQSGAGQAYVGSLLFASGPSIVSASAAIDGVGVTAFFGEDGNAATIIAAAVNIAAGASLAIIAAPLVTAQTAMAGTGSASGQSDAITASNATAAGASVANITSASIAGVVSAINCGSGVSVSSGATISAVVDMAGVSAVSGDGVGIAPGVTISAAGTSTGTSSTVFNFAARPFTIGTAAGLGIIPSASVQSIAKGSGSHDIVKPPTSFQIARAA